MICQCGRQIIMTPSVTNAVCKCGATLKDEPLPDWIQARYNICKTCDQFDAGYCKVLKERGKNGWILHPRGARCEKASCPLKKW